MGDLIATARAMRAAILAGSRHLDDATAATAPMLFPRWKVGMECAAGDRLCHEGKLYRVMQAHVAQADWTPDAAVSLYERIDAVHAGTVGDPIPYEGNMVLTVGLYYVQGGVVYRCIRDTGIPVYATLAGLVGLYVEAVNNEN